MLPCTRLIVVYSIQSKKKNPQFTLNKGFSAVTLSTTGARESFAGGCAVYMTGCLAAVQVPSQVDSAKTTPSSNENSFFVVLF